MGRFIEVNHSLLEAAASSIDQLMATHDRDLNLTELQLAALHGSWSGSDFEAFKHYFQGDNGVKKTGLEISKVITEHAKLLHYSASQYKTAQIDAVNRASRIPI